MRRGGCLRKLAVLFVLLVLIACGAFAYIVGVPLYGWGSNSERWAGNPPLTPAWALECWLWEDDVNTAEFVLELLAGYEEHDFPVRTILLDSPWSTRYNDFLVDEQRYPNPENFFTSLQERGYRVVLWMTNNVNSRSKDTAIQESPDWYEEAAKNGYLTHDGFQARWWKGTGGFIDYTNPAAMQWWRGLQQQLFDWGIDGWKLDGTPTYLMSKFGPYARTHGGWMTLRQYMDHYYCDEYQHGLTQNPEFVTLARSVDDGVPYANLFGFAPLHCAPVTWVGDQDHAWKVEDEGIEEALRDIMKSARLGYNIIGSDVAGYSGGEIPGNVYIRWAQFSTFCGLFLNGGHGERRMWMRSPEELDIVREYSWLHTELVPYIYAYVVQAHEGGEVLMRPVGDGFDYHFGDAFFVSPIHEDTEEVRVSLPEGNWRYWFDQNRVIKGPTNMAMHIPIDEYPVFVRDGAIIPMQVSRDYTGIGDRDWADHLTLNIFPGEEETAFTAHHTDNSGAMTITARGGLAPQVALTGQVRPHILYLFSETPPGSVTANEAPVPAEQWTYDADRKRVIVRSSATEETVYTISTN